MAGKLPVQPAEGGERPRLKDTIFSRERIHHIASQAAQASTRFEQEVFLAHALAGLDALTLMERLRHVATALHAALPGVGFLPALDILRTLAPRIDSKFVTMILPEFVAIYGAKNFDASMDALRYFTAFGSSEFAIRHFLRSDLERTLAVMEGWAHDGDAHVRRLASEGSRPRLPWSFHLDRLIDNPAPAAPILDALRSDASPYVRKSVANHLNDITRDNPGWVLGRLTDWTDEDPRTAWIIRHALRTLVKAGDAEALSLVGASDGANVKVEDFIVEPAQLAIGQSFGLSCRITSMGAGTQTLILDYAIDYVRQNGRTSRKIFKLKKLVLDSGQSANISHRQRMENLSVRRLYPGRHRVELLANGQLLAAGAFELES